MRKLLLAIAGAALMFLLCNCSFPCGGAQSSPEKVVESYLEAFQKGDFDTMVLYTDEPEKSEEELVHLGKFIQMIELLDYSILQVGHLSEVEAAVEIKVTLRLMGQEKVHTDCVRTVMKGGKWYLTGEGDIKDISSRCGGSRQV